MKTIESHSVCRFFYFLQKANGFHEFSLKINENEWISLKINDFDDSREVADYAQNYSPIQTAPMIVIPRNYNV